MADHDSPAVSSTSVHTPESAAVDAEQSSTPAGPSIPNRDEASTVDTASGATCHTPLETTSGSPEREAPASTSTASTAASVSAPAPAAAPASAPSAAPNFPPPKTDKPRPHVCTTCMRSFARLEHLKRHERSHTKEKPFECPSCTRCFARRDLLLRHQQKLHSTTTPSSRPRNGRRESTTGVASGRVRKNSMASTPTTNMRPRASTLGHIDASASGMMASGSFARQFTPMHAHHNSFSGVVNNPTFGFRSLGMSTTANLSGLPRLDTHGLPADASSGLRTAPPFGGFGVEFDMGAFDSQDNGNTINPHALHMHSQSAFPMDCSWDSTQHMYIGLPTSQTLTEEDGFDWVTHGFENQMNFTVANETAIDDSSPSAMSTNSPAHFNESGRPTQGFMENAGQPMGNFWPQNLSNASQMVNSPMSMDVTSFFGEMAPPLVDTVSPKSLLAQKPTSFESGFPTPPELSSIDPATLAMMQNSQFALPLKHENIASTASTASMDSSLRHSSVTTAASDLVTDHVRNVLIAGLNHSSGFGQRNPSQPSTSSPLSPASNKSKGFNASNFPATQDLQRYVSAYIKYYHPHLPFLHVPTLNFESNDSTSYRNGNSISGQNASPSGAGSSCLMLSIAALGALFENEMTHSRELFECAKKLISSYLEERRRSQTSKSQFLPHQRADQEDTPLWLVQAMLLNVIYGHNCGDKQAADIASNHCAALVSLARGAELAKPYPTYLNANVTREGTGGAHNNVNLTPEAWNALNPDMGDSEWYEWKTMEERKRTLYAIFVLSSMLVTAYNRAPALTNSEIRLDLPCDEELWSAESAHMWRSLGGVATAETRSVRFAAALTHLLTAAQRQRRAAATQVTNEPWQHDGSDLRPSSFGCLVLINALHNYIWETRQRHLGRQWTPQEIDSMHAHIEPALRAWQSAWRSNPTHTVERPNPFGAGPLSADSIPLLDLAYVRLFVDFGRSKEAYWQRDYDAMAQELARGSEVLSDRASHPRSSENSDSQPHMQVNDNILEPLSGDKSDISGSQPTQRERHLRKAAFYAADHLMASDRLGLGLSEHNARELPIQSVLCACDSAQVLAEWATTVQERVGKYVGIIGRDEINFMQVPAVLLLDEEDRKLFGTIHELLTNAESRRDSNSALINVQDGGYGSRILVLISDIMTRAAVWPVTKHMARCLEIQSNHVKTRAVASVQAH